MMIDDDYDDGDGGDDYDNNDDDYDNDQDDYDDVGETGNRTLTPGHRHFATLSKVQTFW